MIITCKHGREWPEELGCKCFAVSSWSKNVARETSHNHWHELHAWPALNPWDDCKVRKWYRHWSLRIPRTCNCQSTWQTLPQPDFSGPHEFFRWGWDRHNYISTEHVSPPNPTLTLDEAYAIYWPQHYVPHSADVVIVTSISPNVSRREAQQRATQSWEAIGATVYALNTEQEIAELYGYFPAIHVWQPSKSQPLITELAGVAKQLDRTVLILNSDIEIRGRQPALQDIFRDDSQAVCIRWNYRGEDYAAAREFEWGLDGFTFNASQAGQLPADMPLCIGKPMWDYAIPHFISPRHFIHDRLFFHHEHDILWNGEQWGDGCRWLKTHYQTVVVDYETGGNWRKSLEPDMQYDKRAGRYLPIGS